MPPLTAPDPTLHGTKSAGGCTAQRPGEVWNIGTMKHAKPPPSRHVVNWDHPDLKSLLDKTAGWGLDHRGAFEPVPCELHVGWGAVVGRSASLLYEGEGVLVIAANFVISPAENVRIDYLQAGRMRSRWGIVVEGRAGLRAEDAENGTRVYWVHIR